ncbi:MULTISPECIES: glycolate oxidase subunit GlcE [unclassified Achromobacter]|uniref:glycolate oxidase subunit GlcE n=1 Tax=unclassified Achromobacter TaxID=2626865 RepID=UPI000B51DB9D|nr:MULTISPECIES: glycolate oxidase subunit GlcE [unclassified Achromobacter]OWT67915.1 glycolate oxidase subunit GlcE [Achromobacter sp. HZ34]OWT68011.1 glycolate oxidase subunit GlcE [Achromobacter sp. HZ28]
MEFVLSELCDQVMTAHAGHKPIFITGGGSKAFYGNHRPLRPQDGHCLLDINPYRGIVNYQPSELMVTVRAGTPLQDLEAELAAQGQMLAFEPPHHGSGATVGGCVATGLSGPRRMSAGAVRDFVLGARLLDAQGRVLSFGGEVMKNVAGYDVSRLLAGSQGIFGVILEVSLKVVPRPMEELTLCLEADEAQALALFSRWRGLPMPVSATAWLPVAGTPGQLWVRLSGAPPAIAAGQVRIGGQAVDAAVAAAHWASLREQTHAFFDRGHSLWRLAVPPATPPLGLGPTLLEWGAGQRWLCQGALNDADAMRAAAQACGGHATLFRPARQQDIPADGVFHPLTPGVAQITRRLKQELDPWGLFNPGRLILEL